jgi:hypothetical protein
MEKEEKKYYEKLIQKSSYKMEFEFLEKSPIDEEIKEKITEINREFRIIIKTESERTITGAGTLAKMLKKKMFLMVYNKVIVSDLDKTTVKLRRGLKIDFYVK